MKVTFYIGANNETGEVEKDIVTSVLGAHYRGFTIHDSIGFWEGNQEKSVVATVTGDNLQYQPIAEELKLKLKQDAVLVEVTNPEVLFV